MATEKYPQRNVNMPMDPGAVQAARDRGAPKGPAITPFAGAENGNGSRRQVANGEWIDDRRIVLGAPPTPSEESPPEPDGLSAQPLVVPGSYDPAKVYEVRLGKPSAHAGRVLSADAVYFMIGETCTEVADAIIDAVEIGDIPAEPDAPASQQAPLKTGKNKKG